MKPDLPSGTVTFLFTDIEDSTKLAQQYPDALPALLARHHAILRGAIESNHGQVFRIIGDAFCAAFATPSNTLKAAIMAQRALQHEQSMPTPIQVRIGVHTGEAQTALTEKQSDPYVGYLTLTRVQRVMSTAYGGQILLSDETAELVRRHLPEDVTLRDMGVHRLKGLANLERLWQVCAPDLRLDFPPLPTLATIPNNLPLQLTSFVGRQQELAEVKQLLSSTRLLTLTGPGGTGKTRLSLQLAAEVLETISDGAWLVELAPLADPTLLTQTVAATLGVREQPQRSILDALVDYLRAKNMLLILDNCEHLIEACAQLADTLLRAAPRLKILASSREALGIAGETAYRVPSLPLPADFRSLQDFGSLTQNDCVHLFIDRAIAASPHFHLTEKNAPAIVDICRRLDGIPLAIELAAARVAVFSPEEIAARLDDRFRLLTGGSRAALERHQTLRALIDWSYDLLSDDERMLFRQLSVFAGGWTFEAVQQVCSELNVLNLLTQLVNKSLVVVDADAQAGGTRYRLPETIRQYAREKLFESGEAEQVRDRHLDFFIRFAEQAEPKLRSGEQLVWLERVETESDNLRTALAWSLESGKSESALQLAGALAYFWELRGLSEGSKWLDDALALSEREQSGTLEQAARRAKALYGAGRLRFMYLLDTHASHTIVEESLRLWRELGDKWWIAVALEHVGFMLSLEAPQTARARLEESVSLAREVEDHWPLALCLVRLAGTLALTDVAAARRILEEGVAVARSVGDKSVLSQGLVGLAPLYQLEGNLTAAASVAEEALAASRAIRDFVHEMLSLLTLVITSCLQGDLMKAKGYCFQALEVVRDTGSSQWLSLVLLAFGLVAMFNGQPGRGVRLLAASNTMLRQRGINLLEGGSGPAFMIFNQALEKAQAQLGPAAFEAAQAEGQQMTMEQALALATESESEERT